MALAEASIDVDVICLRGCDEAATEQMDNVTVHRILREQNKESILRYTLHSFHFCFLAFWKLMVLSLSQRIDLIQAHTMPDYLIFVGLCHKLLGRPLILDLHDLSPELFASKWSGWKSRYLLPVVRLVEGMSCRFADHLITTSDGFRACLLSRGVRDRKITLVLNTPHAEVFHPDDSREFHRIKRDARLLYHGTVADRFGLATAIRALHRLQEYVPGSVLEIYGKYDPSCRSHLEGLISDLQLEGQVKLGGWLSFEEIYEVIQRSDIGLVPYHRDGFMELALSTKTFEYAASGLPVVASRLMPVQSVFQSGEITFAEPGDPEDLALRIAELCEDAEARRVSVARSAAALASISGEVMATRYRKVISDLMENGLVAPVVEL